LVQSLDEICELEIQQRLQEELSRLVKGYTFPKLLAFSHYGNSCHHGCRLTPWNSAVKVLWHVLRLFVRETDKGVASHTYDKLKVILMKIFLLIARACKEEHLLLHSDKEETLYRLLNESLSLYLRL